ITDVYGPRLTGSPNHRAAGDWAVRTLSEYGLKNVHLEKWGPFGRGWVNERFYAHAVSPQAYPLIGYPKAWTPGTRGMVGGEAIFVNLATLRTEKDLESWHGKLRGKYVLITAMRDVPPQMEAPGRRLTDQDLANLAKQPEPGQRPGPGGGDPIGINAILGRPAAGQPGQPGQAGAPAAGQPAQAGFPQQNQQEIPLYVPPADPTADQFRRPRIPPEVREFARKRMQFFIDEGV